MTKQSHCIAGSITAGCFSTFLGHPLDTIKVHQQTNSQLSRISIFDTSLVLAKGNISRLFRGIGPPMTSQIIMNTVMFSVYNRVKDATTQSTIFDANSSAFVAGLFSGFATACISTPSDWLKIQSQISLSNKSYKQSSRYDMLSLLRHHLIRDGKVDVSFLAGTLYSGHIANLMREGVFTMVYLGMYDRISCAVKASRGNDQPLGMETVVVIGSFTGACAWICNYPFDTIKTVIQAKTTKYERITIKYTIQLIYCSGGWKAFWRGAGSSTLRAMLVTSSRMLAYEKTIQILA